MKKYSTGILFFLLLFLFPAGEAPARARSSGNEKKTALQGAAASPSKLTAVASPHTVKAAHKKGHQGRAPSPFWVTFFVLLLLCIAILPLVIEHWWESNLHKAYVTAGIALPVLIYYAVVDYHAIFHSLEEFFSFIVLLWSLYTISGGIVLRGNLKATPKVNTAFLAIGALIANIFGTTGAAMLLIRPLLRTNMERQYKKHIMIFFIFLVANIGGCLTPLGDPPLFLGFLRGVPFEWTLKLWPIWITEIAILLVIFYIWDTKAYAKEKIQDKKLDVAHKVPLSIAGKWNFLLIGGVMAAVLLSTPIHNFCKSNGIWQVGQGSPWRELIMIIMGLLSMKITRKVLRKENNFNFVAIIEVAVLFAGIFITMIPALKLLNLHGSSLGVNEPWQFMWATGILSSFLDNAPTYLVFTSMGQSVTAAASGIAPDALMAMTDPQKMAMFIQHKESLLVGISIGAVFMGANTYIGNAPNFMVKVIADTAGEQRIKMPSFFGYMKYSALILMPTFVVVTLIYML